jgi:hypothetical protein
MIGQNFPQTTEMNLGYQRKAWLRSFKQIVEWQMGKAQHFFQWTSGVKFG